MAGLSRTRARAARFLAVVLLLSAGCNIIGPSHDDESSRGVPDTHRLSPDSLLAWFARAQADTTRSLDAVRSCLHPDFDFHFNEQDRVWDPTLPVQWNHEEYERATGRMFQRADSIDVVFNRARFISEEVCGGTHDAVICRLFEVSVTMTVVVPEPGSEPTIYPVGGLADVAVARDPADTTRWVIREILDRTNQLERGERVSGGLEPAPAATIPATWGVLLAIFDRIGGP